MDWERHWNAAPAAVAEDDFLRQVGKTVCGVPIDDALLQVMADSAIDALDLGLDDTLLDLCCGNGLLTTRLAAHVGRTVGVDYSVPLVEIARRHHGDDIRYVCGSALDHETLQTASSAPAGPFTKVLMHEALQHFAADELGELLEGIESVVTPGGRVLFASVPDQTRLDHFYDTPERREEHRRRVADGTEAIGTWWDPDAIIVTANDRGHAAHIRAQDARLHTAHYRFDLLIEIGGRR